ncbi:MAG: hypothetical protein JRN15_13295 [Nitrososphaerota archaeon]|nr:hypothetical protein [Nitrososphaerota archaeon]
MSVTKAWGFLMVAIAFNIMGNLLMKYAASRPFSHRLEVFFSWGFLVGGFFFGLNLLAYTQAQVRMPISLAYPVLVGMSVVGVAFGAYYYFGEDIGIKKLIGMGFIILGIVLIGDGD